MVQEPKPSPVVAAVVTGVVPPLIAEARLREAWPSLFSVNPPLAGLAWTLIRSMILAPVGWLLMLPVFLQKFAPFICARYTLTNRRVMMQRGWNPHMVQEVLLTDISDVRLDVKTVDSFYITGTLEVVDKAGKVAMTLTGVPEPSGFKEAILNARRAWGTPATENIGVFKAASQA